jgi:hypothetical protein
MSATAETITGGAGSAPAPLAIRVIAATTCAVCWADPGMPCGDSRGDLPGLHLARYARAARSGIIPLAVAVAVLEAAGPVFTSHTLVLTSPGDPAVTDIDADGMPLAHGDQVHVEYEDSGVFTGTDPGGRLLVRLDDGHQAVTCDRAQVHRLTRGDQR